MLIVAAHAEGLELVTQPDHARLASEILALWRSEDLPAHPRRRQLLFAVREHDNGWREADAAPRLDPATGEPIDFRSYPRAERFDLWRRALDRLAESPYAAALVAHHAHETHRDRPRATWGGFRDELAARRDEALREAALSPEELRADYRYLDLGDTISLVACGAFDEARCRGFSIRRRDIAVELDPFPLTGATTFQVPLRVLPRGPYRDAPQMVGELAAARWTRRPVRLAPAGP